MFTHKNAVINSEVALRIAVDDIVFTHKNAVINSEAKQIEQMNALCLPTKMLSQTAHRSIQD